MDNLILKLTEDTKIISFSNVDNYLKTYPYFITYFKNIEIIENEHFVIGSHFVYGWMPTILKTINYQEIDDVVKVLNKSKINIELLKYDELEILKRSINNSIVGASKLLHFISPKKYPIYDSRIFRYLSATLKFKAEVNNIANYEKYLGFMNEVINNEYVKVNVISKIKNNYKEIFGDDNISDLRALELLMFETDKKSNKAESIADKVE